MSDIDFGRMSALVVDDEHMMRLLLVGLLRDIGVGKIMEASDGAEALKYLDGTQKLDIDVVVCDLEMPIIDGLEFVEMLRKSKTAYNPDVPVVIVTGYSEMSKIQRAVRLGIHGFLVKPVSLVGLENQTIRAIERKTIDPGRLTQKRKQDDKGTVVMDFNKK